MKLKTETGEVHFNPSLIANVHLNSDRSLLTVHFVDGTHMGFTADAEEERVWAAAFLEKLTAEQTGFVAVGQEVINLRSALWITIPTEGPIQVRSGDGRTRTVEDEKGCERISKLLAE